MSETKLIWDSGTAYDFFISISVIHDPARFGLRGSWAAGVRSRIPAAEREVLQHFANIAWPLNWVYSLPGPKNGQSILSTLEKIPADERLKTLAFGNNFPKDWEEHLLRVTDQGSWNEEDVELLTSLYCDNSHDTPQKKIQKKAKVMLELWSKASELEDGLLDALKAYYDNFFAEEEIRIRPAIQEALVEAKKLAETLPVSELMLQLSQGVYIEEWENYENFIMVPSFWSTPLMLFVPVDEKTEIRVFGARPSNASLVPGEVVPDALYQALKAMADPTRLRILHYLSAEPMSPAELARRLRLRPPTVLHHLDSLRLARLVQMNISHEGKRYTARHEAIKETCAMLETFIGIPPS